jgi:hypothetical protein
MISNAQRKREAARWLTERQLRDMPRGVLQDVAQTLGVGPRQDREILIRAIKRAQQRPA